VTAVSVVQIYVLTTNTASLNKVSSFFLHVQRILRQKSTSLRDVDLVFNTQLVQGNLHTWLRTAAMWPWINWQAKHIGLLRRFRATTKCTISSIQIICTRIVILRCLFL